MQRALRLIYPDQCILCANVVDGAGALCGACWRKVPFSAGHRCDHCGASLIGDDVGVADLCEDCLEHKRPWTRGRAVFSYADAGRRVVLSLKHGDRTDLVPSVAQWMVRAGGDVLLSETLLVPVPLHWTRLVRRKFNQSAELTNAIGRLTGLQSCPDALVRSKRTPAQNGMTLEQRIVNVSDAIQAHPRRSHVLRGRKVCIVDDVMTSGATLSACAEACYAAGASEISCLVLARVEKTP